MKLFLFLALILMLSGGCAARTPSDMYSLPRRTARNESLRTAVEHAMANHSYAAPLSGENCESVQNADLDGDGRDEYIVFSRNLQDDMLQILLFHQNDAGDFAFWGDIDCKGSSFEQVSYAQVDGKPGYEMIVGSGINERVIRTVAVYSFGSGEPEKLKSMIYQRYLCTDLNQDSLTEVIVIQSGDYDADNGVARLYHYTDGNIEGSAEVKLSAAPSEIRRITVNQLEDGQPAVYITSNWYGDGMITDVLCLREDGIENIIQSGIQGLQREGILPEDVNSDGMIELPSPLTMLYNTPGQCILRWYTLDMEGKQKDKLFTFHNFREGWYVELDPAWIDRISVESGGGDYTFFMWNNSYGSAVPVFSLYTLTGKDRDSEAAIRNRFALYRGDTVVYAGKLESASAIYGITEAYLTEHFRLIRHDWKTSES